MRILINHIRYNIFQSDAIKVWKHIHKLFKSPQSQSLVGLLCNFFWSKSFYTNKASCCWCAPEVIGLCLTLTPSHLDYHNWPWIPDYMLWHTVKMCNAIRVYVFQQVSHLHNIKYLSKDKQTNIQTNKQTAFMACGVKLNWICHLGCKHEINIYGSNNNK